MTIEWIVIIASIIFSGYAIALATSVSYHLHKYSELVDKLADAVFEKSQNMEDDHK